jgi:glycosyltransferase involved in cell wall biosynthesis
MEPNRRTTLSVIAPVYQNEAHLRRLHAEVAETIGRIANIDAFELVLVDDGSPDDSWKIICELSAEDHRVKGLKFSRNFGQHHAITAGLDACSGDWAVVMDADGQDPPAAIAQLWEMAQKGYHVVNARRVERTDHRVRVWLSNAYHDLFQWLSGFNYDREVANFRLIHRKVIDALKQMRESFRGFPLHVHWLGFASTSVDVLHSQRWSGRSTYSPSRLLALALEVAVTYSNKPLKIVIGFGLALSLLSAIGILIIILRSLFLGLPVPGWVSLMASVWLFSGLILAQLGIMGLYIARVVTECQGRPLYAVAEKANFESP